jgi:hypothetical protein
LLQADWLLLSAPSGCSQHVPHNLLIQGWTRCAPLKTPAVGRPNL